MSWKRLAPFILAVTVLTTLSAMASHNASSRDWLPRASHGAHAL